MIKQNYSLKSMVTKRSKFDDYLGTMFVSTGGKEDAVGQLFLEQPERLGWSDGRKGKESRITTKLSIMGPGVR